MEMYTVSFFGHRIIDDLNKVQNELENIISKIVSEHEYVQFLVGRDGDFDIIAASAVKRVKKTLFIDNVDLNLVLPYMRAEISNNIEYMLDYYNDIQVDNDARKAHFKTAIKIRNQNMVKKSQLVICYVEKNKGGAYNAMKYAQKQDCTVINIAKNLIKKACFYESNFTKAGF